MPGPPLWLPGRPQYYVPGRQITRPQPPPANTVLAPFNTFEGGTNGVTLTQGTGGNTGGVSGQYFNGVTIGGGATLAFDNTHSAHGSLSCQVATAGSATAYAQWGTSPGPSFFSSPAPLLFWRMYLYFTANPTNNHHVWQSTSPAGTSPCSANINTAGKVTMANQANSTIITSASTIPLNAWFRLEGMAYHHSTQGQVAFRIYTTPDSTTPSEELWSTATNNTYQAGGPISVRFGVGGAVASVGPFWMDDIALSDTSWIGPYNYSQLRFPADYQTGTTDTGSGTDAGESITLIGPSGSPFLENTAEGGSSGTTVSTANSGGASGTAFDTVTIGANATLTYDNAQAHSGTQSYKAVTQASGSLNAYVYWKASLTAAPVTQAWFRVYGYFGSYTGNVRLIEALLNNTTLRGFVSVNNAGKPFVSDSLGTNLGGAAGALPTNAWWRLEGYFLGDPSAGAIQLKIFRTNADGSVPDETLTFTGINTGGTLDTLRFGNPGSVGSYTFWMDDLGSSLQGYIGPYAPANEGLADAGTGTDAGEKVSPQGSDTGTGVDAGEQITVSDTETGSGTESGQISVSDADTGTSAETTSVAPQGSDTGTGTDAVLQLAVLGADTGTGVDAGEAIHLSTADIGSGADAATIALTSADAAIGAETQYVIIFSSDSMAGNDGQSLSILSADTGTGAEGQSLSIFSTDAGTGTDGQSLALLSSDALTGADAAQVALFSSDLGTGTESALLRVISADTISSAETQRAGELIFSADTGFFTEAEILKILDADYIFSAEGQNNPILAFLFADYQAKNNKAIADMQLWQEAIQAGGAMWAGRYYTIAYQSGLAADQAYDAYQLALRASGQDGG